MFRNSREGYVAGAEKIGDEVGGRPGTGSWKA